MNEAEALVLGRRAKRCASWKWAPGMQVFAPRPHGAGAPETGALYARLVSMGGLPQEMADRRKLIGLVDCDAIRDGTQLAPDFRDPATMGWLIALVREAYADSTLCAVSYGHSMHPDDRVVWRIDARESDDPLNAIPNLYGFDSEVEALVRALEGASLSAQEDETDT